jgi:hypothetical protein
MGATWATLENTGLKSRHLETAMSRALGQPNTQQRPNHPSSLSFGDHGKPSGEAGTVLLMFEVHTEPSSLSDLEVVGYTSNDPSPTGCWSFFNENQMESSHY